MNFMKIIALLINFFERTANYIRDFYNKYEAYIGLVFRIVFGIIIVSFLFGKCHRRTERKTLPYDTVFVFKTDTAFIRDTVTRVLPRPYAVAKTDTMYVRDTVIIREHKFYKDSLYEAWVSGYEPSLDSIKVYNKTDTRYITETKTIEKNTSRMSIYPYVGVFSHDNKIGERIGIAISTKRGLYVGADVGYSNKNISYGCNVGFNIK